MVASGCPTQQVRSTGEERVYGGPEGGHVPSPDWATLVCAVHGSRGGYLKKRAQHGRRKQRARARGRVDAGHRGRACHASAPLRATCRIGDGRFGCPLFDATCRVVEDSGRIVTACDDPDPSWEFTLCLVTSGDLG